MQTLRDLLDRHDYDGLYELKADLEDQIEGWRSEYNVESPDGLRDQSTDSIDSTTTKERKQAANGWELLSTD